jgi:GTP-binding protein YchF
MEAGIVGLPYVGKTAVFNALTALGVETEGSATKPNLGVVAVIDPRLEMIHQHIETKKIVPATLQLVDVAGLVAGASEGKGTGNKFLSHVRNVDAILHVVRCFDDPNVPHVDGSVDPVRDIEEVETELMLADLEVVENSIKNAQRKARTGDKQAKLRLELMEICQTALSEGTTLSRLDLSDQHKQELKNFAMLSAKPVLYVANVGEDDLAGQSAYVQQVRDYAAERGGEVVCICAKLEAELSELDDDERHEMLEGMGLAEPALAVLGRAAYRLLGLASYFTAGPKEIKAWTMPIGSTGPQAAGVIHSDFERGFIRVEVYSVDDLEQYKSEKALREVGKIRVEGKNYIVQDGDVCHFLFNV